jgi:ATP-dependent DNA ligase
MAFQRKEPAAIGVKAPIPGIIEPTLASSIDKVPVGERWIHEIKFDGYRVQLHLANESVRIFTRPGHDCLTERSGSPSCWQEIEYRPAEGKIRYPFFKGIREDL